LAEIGIGGNDRAGLAVAVGILKLLKIDAKRSGELHPVRRDLVARDNNDDVVFAVVDETLGDAKGGRGLPGSRAVGKQDPVVAVQPLLCLVDVLVLLGQQQRQSCVDAGLVAPLGGFRSLGLSG